ncbi:unnamed protein product [Linum trigynum]|uniref:Uncharacterized protein n=1 Tax=Linum trigynum TaxID=586398 RepID=A0AAV2CIW5_9ROSI
MVFPATEILLEEIIDRTVCSAKTIHKLGMIKSKRCPQRKSNQPNGKSRASHTNSCLFMHSGVTHFGELENYGTFDRFKFGVKMKEKREMVGTSGNSDERPQPNKKSLNDMFLLRKRARYRRCKDLVTRHRERDPIVIRRSKGARFQLRLHRDGVPSGCQIATVNKIAIIIATVEEKGSSVAFATTKGSIHATATDVSIEAAASVVLPIRVVRASSTIDQPPKQSVSKAAPLEDHVDKAGEGHFLGQYIVVVKYGGFRRIVRPRQQPQLAIMSILVIRHRP